MKIRFLLHDVYGKGGGVVTVTLALAGELAKEHDVELVSLFGRRGAPVHQLPSGVQLSTLIPPGRPDRLAVRRRRLAAQPSAIIPSAEPRAADYSRYTDRVLRRYLRSLRGGALVTMQPGLNIAAARFGTDRYVRVAQDHRPLSNRPKGIRKAYRRLDGGLDTFLTLTDPDTEELRRLLGERIPVATMTNAAPQYDGPRSTCDAKVVVAAGRLSHTKGFDILIDAWVDVAERHPDWELQIWGEGHLREDLAERITTKGLQRQVRLMGYSAQLQTKMAQASMLVLSSRAEGFGRVLIEAMACGLPVVSTDCPWGPRQIITHEVNGLLVENENPQALAAAINDLIERGTEARAAMGSAGIDRAKETSQEVVARRWSDLLGKLLVDKGLAEG